MSGKKTQPLIVIYKEDGILKMRTPEENINIYELIGFLECVLVDMKDHAIETWESFK